MTCRTHHIEENSRQGDHVHDFIAPTCELVTAGISNVVVRMGIKEWLQMYHK